ncbi:hypothetical protein J2Z31_002842 [Sinorhizobium kostiense]|uniref:Transmembrane protein n=1 Tax=Sinorhizobium kostiense TaxID=76747 RepID=A0ABS4R0B3_9HYPH|nr:hypothetical protein [Sinorhizobium kostiense]MBP2236328.1 hypothetical protein [Sinorhizobium kostiense]
MSTSEQLPDAISAASLVLAVLAALYTLWLPTVTAALDATPPADPDDRGSLRTQVTGALVTKAVPLAFATIASTAILLPRGMAILWEVWTHHAEWAYDDVKAFFVLTLLLMLLLAAVSIVQLVRLVVKRVRL